MFPCLSVLSCLCRRLVSSLRSCGLMFNSFSFFSGTARRGGGGQEETVVVVVWGGGGALRQLSAECGAMSI